MEWLFLLDLFSSGEDRSCKLKISSLIMQNDRPDAAKEWHDVCEISQGRGNYRDAKPADSHDGIGVFFAGNCRKGR
ncbi:MAG: hypothetical protein Tsb009_18900 [Planctomycetaceae bacterium]